MFVLRLALKLFLVPVWLLLWVCWLTVHMLVIVCSLFHGLGKLLFGGMAILAVCLNLWDSAAVFAGVMLATFIIVFAGSIVEVLFEGMRSVVGHIVFA